MLAAASSWRWPALGLPSLSAWAERRPGTIFPETSFIGAGQLVCQGDGHQSVAVNVCGICVMPEGTVFSAGVDEDYGVVASYKAGVFLTKCDYDSGFGSTASVVAEDGEYVYILRG